MPTEPPLLLFVLSRSESGHYLPPAMRFCLQLAWLATIGCLLVAIDGATAPAHAAGDSITIRLDVADGGERELTDLRILDVRLDEIRYRDLDADDVQAVPSARVIRFHIDPLGRSSRFATADKLRRGGYFGPAIGHFRHVRADPTADRLEKLLAQVHICDCAMKLGARRFDSDSTGYQTAVAGASDFLDNVDYAQSWYRPDMLEWLGVAWQAMDRPEQAAEAFTRLSTLAPARGALRLAALLLHTGEPRNALDGFRRALALAIAVGDAGMVERCGLRVALTCMQLGQLQTAREDLQRLVGNGAGAAVTPEVCGSAWLALGQMSAQDGEWETAFMCAARTATVFKCGIEPGDWRTSLELARDAARELATADAAWQQRAEKLDQVLTHRWPRR